MPVMRQLDIVQPAEGAEEPRPRGTMPVRSLGCASLRDRRRSRDGVFGGHRAKYREYFADSPG